MKLTPFPNNQTGNKLALCYFCSTNGPQLFPQLCDTLHIASLCSYIRKKTKNPTPQKRSLLWDKKKSSRNASYVHYVFLLSLLHVLYLFPQWLLTPRSLCSYIAPFPQSTKFSSVTHTIFILRLRKNADRGTGSQYFHILQLSLILYEKRVNPR